MPKTEWLLVTTMSLTVMFTAGCREPDQRLSELSRQCLAEQAQQNQRLIQQSQVLAEASGRLVEAEGEARREVIQLQRQLQAEVNSERQALHRQQADIEQERRQLAAARQRDPIVAAAIVQAGTLLACLIPLVFGCYLLRYAGMPGTSEADLVEVLVTELTSTHPRILPTARIAPPEAIGARQPEPQSLPAKSSAGAASST